MIAILGGLHLLPDTETRLSNFLFGERQLIGDHLRAMNIPHIKLFQQVIKKNYGKINLMQLMLQNLKEFYNF